MRWIFICSFFGQVPRNQFQWQFRELFFGPLILAVEIHCKFNTQGFVWKVSLPSKKKTTYVQCKYMYIYIYIYITHNFEKIHTQPRPPLHHLLPFDPRCQEQEGGKNRFKVNPSRLSCCFCSLRSVGKTTTSGWPTRSTPPPPHPGITGTVEKV